MTLHDGASSRSDNRRAAWRNAAWLASEKLLRLLLALAVGVAVARHLGPQDYGRLNLALSWVALLGSFAWFGVGDAVTRDLVRDRTQEGLLLGSALWLRGAGSLLAVGSVVLALLTGLIPATAAPLAWILCLSLPLAEITGGWWLWFQSHVQIGRAVRVRQVALMAGALARLAVVVGGGGVEAVAWTMVGESAISGLGLLWAYRRAGGRYSHWQFSATHARTMLRGSWPLLVGAMVAALNARVDQLMLGALADTTAVGIYAAATRLSEIWWVVPTLLVQSFAPRFVFAPGLAPTRVERHLALGMLGLSMLAVLIALVMSALSSPLAGRLFGAAYTGAAAVLVVHVWIAVFLFVDTVQNQALIALGLQSALWRKAVLALGVNVLANAALVPRFGAPGAAWGTLLAQAVSCLVFHRLDEPTRGPILALQRRAGRLAWACRRWARMRVRPDARKADIEPRESLRPPGAHHG